MARKKLGARKLNDLNKTRKVNRRKFSKDFAHTTAAFFLFLMLFGCKLSAKKPNIVYVFADQWRASAFGYTGNPNIKTPNIDRLANEGLNLTNTVAVTPLCTPYRASLMTGRYPTSTGMFLNDLYLPSGELCMPEILKNAGYSTAYIGKWHLDGHGRHSYIPPERRQGWDYWKGAECNHNNYRSHYYTEDSDEKLYWDGYDAFAQTNDAREYIIEQANEEQPFILMLSYGPPHPSSPPAPEKYRALYPVDEIELPPNVPKEYQDEARLSLHQYYAHGTALDKCVGDLMHTIEEAGIADNTIFVFTSDHGGMHWSHGLPFKWKQVAWDESAHVPFLLRFPAIHGHQGRVIETPLNTPDILPTILALSGVEVPESVEGDDLSALITKGTELQDRSVLYMSVAPIVGQGEAHRSIRTKRYTYVRNLEGPFLLFDDLRDPWQMNNLIGNAAYVSLQRELDAELQGHLQRIGDDFRPPQSYIEEWGYELGDNNEIPYGMDDKVQSPSGKGGL